MNNEKTNTKGAKSAPKHKGGKNYIKPKNNKSAKKPKESKTAAEIKEAAIIDEKTEKSKKTVGKVNKSSQNNSNHLVLLL